jgi:hypothetical protein
MLDYPGNQAAGLTGLAAAQGTQLLAMVSHGDEAAELPLLWKLCAVLVDFGYDVTVLDATMRECDANPGLVHLLEDSYAHASEPAHIPAWNVIPAALGLRSLCTEGGGEAKSLRRLGTLFQHSGILIVYSKVDWLEPLLVGSKMEPLLAVSSLKNSLLTSYMALKRLLVNGKLAPTIVSIVSGDAKYPETQPSAVALNLVECARNFLGFDVNTLNIALRARDDSVGEDIRRLALRLLESAMPLETDAMASPRMPPVSMGGFAWSH